MIAIIFGLILGFVHYFSDKIHLKYRLHKTKLISLAAGISVSFIFLELFPELFKGTEYLHRLSVLAVLAGFSILHIIEKHVYSNSLKRKMKSELEREHCVAFFIYHFIIGMVLSILTKEDFITGLLFFFPLVFHIAISSISLNEIEKIHRKTLANLFLSASTLFGVLFALGVPITLPLFHLLTGFIVGAFLYIIIRDFIPRERGGKIAFFILGVVAYTAIILLTWIS